MLPAFRPSRTSYASSQSAFKHLKTYGCPFYVPRLPVSLALSGIYYYDNFYAVLGIPLGALCDWR